MYLNYKNIKLDTDGSPIQPVLKLQNLSGKTHGILSNVKDLELSINFAELSEISFSVPRVVDGKTNPLYGKLTGYKVIHTDKYGVYLLTTPETVGSGLEEVKNIKGSSIEKIFERKKFFLPEGTYALYSSTDDTNTIVAFIKELDPTWEIRHVDDSLKGRYRTFDEYDGDALSFMYGDMMEKYRCLVVFDPYKDATTGKRGIYLYDADAEISMSHIYLSYENLLKETEVTELSDELVTKLNVYGADSLSIRDVNPTGQDYIVNLDHFINIGDIDEELGAKVTAWQNMIVERRTEYTTLVALKAASSAKKMSLEAQDVDLNGELDKLVLEQSAIFQKIALDTTDDADGSLKEELDAKNAEIAAKEAEISSLANQITRVQETIDEYTEQITDIATSLRFDNYGGFTNEERNILSQYMIEDDVTEETFVATSYETSAESCFNSYDERLLHIGDVESYDEVDINEAKKMFRVKGGQLILSDSIDDEGNIVDQSISAKVIELVIERTQNSQDTKDTEILVSARVGRTIIGDKTYDGGNITVIVPSISTALPDFAPGVFSVHSPASTVYFTADVTEYEKYSVKNELYDHGLTILSEQAFPFYEFTVDSGNFLFSQEFEEFKDELALGKGIYLMLGSHGRVRAPLIGIDIDFSDIASLKLTFSNKFQKSDGKARLKELIEKSYSSSRSFDASQYAYKETAKQMSFVSEYLSSSLDAAKNNILAAADQSVNISGAGITLTSSNPDYAQYQMRLVNNMLAITNDNWQTASLAVGLMPLPSRENENMMGMVVNADVIAGKLLIGENLVIESQSDDGESVQFRFDENGAYLRNATLLSENLDGTTQIAIDPEVGIAMGEKGVVSEDEDGNLVVDSSKASFYFDADGNLKLSGNITMSGNITWDTASTPVRVLYAGLNLPAYRFTPSKDYNSYTSGYVQSDWHRTYDPKYDYYASYSYSGGTAGTWTAAIQIRGKDGDPGDSANVTDDAIFNLLTESGNKVGIFGFTGEGDEAKLYVNATHVHGGMLSGCSIGIGYNGGTSDNSANNYNFYVDDDGNITLNGNITWGASNGPVKVLYARIVLNTPTGSYDNFNESSSTAWHTKYNSTYDYYASYSYDGGATWTEAVRIRGQNGTNATVTDATLFNILTNNGNQTGIFNAGVDSNGNTKMFINATYIDTDTLVASKISTVNEEGYGLVVDDGIMNLCLAQEVSDGSASKNVGYIAAMGYQDMDDQYVWDEAVCIHGDEVVGIVADQYVEIVANSIGLFSKESSGSSEALIFIDQLNERIDIRGNIYINGELVYEL